MKKWKRVAALVLCLLLSAGLWTTGLSAADIYQEPTLRVGLIYGSSATPGVNAFAEYGFELGYYDEFGSFAPLWMIEERFISFTRDSSLVLAENKVSLNDGTVFGTNIEPYHLELDYTFLDTWELVDYLYYLQADCGLMLPIFPAYTQQGLRIRLGAYASLEETEFAAWELEGYTAGLGALIPVGESPTCITVVGMNSHTILFEFDTEAYNWPAVLPLQAGDGSVTFLKNGSKFYEGTFEAKRLTGENISLINRVSMESYVAGVLPLEMMATYPIEALKAQAVAARTYAYCSLGKHQSSGFDVCPSTDCQMYGGVTDSESILRAVSETRGCYATYEGEPFTTYFYSSNGGYTESNHYVWGGTEKPYYAAVEDPFDDSSPWSNTVSGASLGEYLNEKGYDIGEVVRCYVSEYTVPANNVYAITFEDAYGQSVTIRGCDTLRARLNKYVKSASFEVTSKMNVFVNESEAYYGVLGSAYAIGGDGTVSQIGLPSDEIQILSGSGELGSPQVDEENLFTFTGKGWGHLVGMSQYGAKGMAEAGYFFDEIIQYYYTGSIVMQFYN